MLPSVTCFALKELRIGSVALTGLRQWLTPLSTFRRAPLEIRPAMNRSAAKPQPKIKKPRIDPPLLGRSQTSRDRYGYRDRLRMNPECRSVRLMPSSITSRETNAFTMHMERELLLPVHLG